MHLEELLLLMVSINEKLAKEISKTFVEIVVGKKITKEAKNIFQK